MTRPTRPLVTFPYVLPLGLVGLTFTHFNEVNSGNVLPYTLNTKIKGPSLVKYGPSTIIVEGKNLQIQSPDSFAYLIAVKSKYHLHKEIFTTHFLFSYSFEIKLSVPAVTAHSMLKQNNKEMFAEVF